MSKIPTMEEFAKKYLKKTDFDLYELRVGDDYIDWETILELGKAYAKEVRRITLDTVEQKELNPFEVYKLNDSEDLRIEAQ
jgi:hypothetical protein